MWKKTALLVLVLLCVVAGYALSGVSASASASEPASVDDQGEWAEYQDRFERYVEAWSFYSPFQFAFDKDTMGDLPLSVCLLWDLCGYIEGVNNLETHGYENIPADVVEDIIIRHFPITAEQLRTIPSTTDWGDHYNADTNAYTFEGGFGGPGSNVILKNVEEDGDLLRFSCDWYAEYDDAYEFSQTVTIRLGDGEHDFYYLENILTTK